MINTLRPVYSALPTEMTLGGQTYDIPKVRRFGGTADTHHGKDKCDHLLKHQGDIPVELQGEVEFVFTDYRCPDDLDIIYCVLWNGRRWVRGWLRIGRVCYGDWRVLRRHRTRA